MMFSDDRLLFVDDRNIESSENVCRNLNAPVKAGSCFQIEKPWEMGGARACSVLPWEGGFRLYYTVKPPGKDRSFLAMAVSSDGISWDRPDLGVVPFDGTTSNNLCDTDDQGTNEVAVFADPSAPDLHRFKMIAHSPSMGGMFLLTSQNGIRFKRHPGHLINYIVDNHMSAFYDERVEKYRIYTRGWDRSRPIPPMRGSRTVVLAETDDLFKPVPLDENAPDPWEPGKKWEGTEWEGVRRVNRELPAVIACDAEDPPTGGIYQAAAVQYLPDTYLAFPSLYYHYPWPPDGRFINDGTIDLQFACSADGVSWDRGLRGPYVRLDLPAGPCTKMMHMLSGMVPNGHLLSQYYVGGRRTHGEGRVNAAARPVRDVREGDPVMYRLEQRIDGFVFAESAWTGGALVTRAFVLEGPRLSVNIDSPPSGEARAALLDENGRAIDGFALEQSGLIHGNDIRLPLTWNKSDDVSSLAGRRVKLLVKSRSARLFAVYPKG